MACFSKNKLDKNAFATEIGLNGVNVSGPGYKTQVDPNVAGLLYICNEKNTGENNNAIGFGKSTEPVPGISNSTHLPLKLPFSLI